MENAVWKDEKLIASDVANEFELERVIRKASGRRELLCPDKGCKSPIVRYCHGEIKGAYFAHLTNDQCDYADFDKNDTTVFRLLRMKLREHFSKLGYMIKSEQKVLEHHYTQLFFELSDGDKIALELGSNLTTAILIDKLTEDYKNIGVGIRWLVVSDTNYANKENELFYLKRYLVNKSTYHEYIIINKDGTTVSQSRWDCNKYEYNGQCIYLKEFKDFYTEDGDLNSLILNDKELTIVGFSDRYCLWLQHKKRAVENEINKIKEREKRLAERKFEETKVINQRYIFPIIHKIEQYAPKQKDYTLSSYEKRKSEIINRMNQQEEQVRDSADIRWIKCEICGKIGEDAEFSNYGGEGHLNLGVCCDCTRKNRYSKLNL